MAGKNRPVTIVADRPFETWEQFFVDAIESTQNAIDTTGSNVQSQVVISKLENGNLVCGWEQTEANDLVDMAASLLFDAIEMFVGEYIERNYGDMLEDDDAEDADDGGELEC
jgi:hypothetical protein